MYMYILKCSNDGYYTGSTKNLEKRIAEHFRGEGSNYTRKHSPVELVYFETFERIDFAFYREKQVQKWSRKKKEALINSDFNELKALSACMNETASRLHLPAVLLSRSAPLNDRLDDHLEDRMVSLDGRFDSAQRPNTEEIKIT